MLQVYLQTLLSKLGKKMSNVWPIAIIGLLTIVILFYALEQCGKIFREGKNLNQRSTQRQNKRKKNHEQYVSVSKFSGNSLQIAKENPSIALTSSLIYWQMPRLDLRSAK